jgi:hypothetical protein
MEAKYSIWLVQVNDYLIRLNNNNIIIIFKKIALTLQYYELKVYLHILIFNIKMKIYFSYISINLKY